jgi:hypothetical protein
LDARMENISDRDAGFGLVNCLDVPDKSDFWRRVYNMGGGPGMRTIAYEYMRNAYKRSGLNLQACVKRNWYALRNFHMQYYEDSAVLNDYLHHWRDTLESYQHTLNEDTPVLIKLVAFLAGKIPALRARIEKVAYADSKKLSENHRNSPRYWYTDQNGMRITAFFKSYEGYEQIPEWGVDMPDLDPEAPWERLDHGYDESKSILDLKDLHGAAQFRGGKCLSDNWEGDWYVPLDWECAFGHTFTARSFSVLKAGHWCPDCAATWNYDQQAKKNPFLAQVWYADHTPYEDNFYPEDCINDIRDADREFATLL